MDPASFPGGHGRSWTTAGAPPGRRACLRRSARRAGSAAIAAIVVPFFKVRAVQAEGWSCVRPQVATVSRSGPERAEVPFGALTGGTTRQCAGC